MRKHTVVTIADEGRDKGKSFLVLEMDAFRAEKWATRALLALSRAGVEVPPEIFGAGALGFLAVGLDAMRRIAYDDAEPLLAEMMACVSFVPNASHVDPLTQRPLTRPLALPDDVNSGDVEEVTTLLKLREAALELHLGFSVTAALSNLAAAVNSSRLPAQTSPESSPRSSRRKKAA